MSTTMTNKSSSSTYYFWKYVSVATDYVGITNNENEKYNKKLTKEREKEKKQKIKQKQRQKQRQRQRANLYDEIGIECINFLANLLDSSRPKLNNNKHRIITEKILSKMEKKYIILIEVFTFLSFQEIIQLMINDNLKNENKQLSLSLNYLIYNDLSGYKFIRKSCFNLNENKNRNIIWPYLICHNFEIIKYHQLYNKYIKHIKYFNHSIISKDIDRTLIITENKHKNLNEIYKKHLKNILSIYCLLDGECGYIQGMNYIVANILIALNGNVRNAFAVFCHFMKRDLSPVYIMDNHNKHSVEYIEYIPYAYTAGGKFSKLGNIGYGLRDLYLPSLPGLIITLLQFESLIKLYLPLLYQHFVSQGISVQNYASEWFLSLFCYILPLKLSLFIMDIFICDGWKILHRIGLALLFKAKFKILSQKLSFGDILLFLKRKDLIKQLFNNDYHLFIQIAMQFKVTNRMLHENATLLFTKSMTKYSKFNNNQSINQ